MNREKEREKKCKKEKKGYRKKKEENNIWNRSTIYIYKSVYKRLLTSTKRICMKWIANDDNNLLFFLFLLSSAFCWKINLKLTFAVQLRRLTHTYARTHNKCLWLFELIFRFSPISFAFFSLYMNFPSVLLCEQFMISHATTCLSLCLFYSFSLFLFFEFPWYSMYLDH